MTNDTYIGSVSFPSLVSEPEDCIVVSSAYGAELFEVCWKIGETLCVR